MPWIGLIASRSAIAREETGASIICINGTWQVIAGDDIFTCESKPLFFERGDQARDWVEQQTRRIGAELEDET
jgi:hypothetical protein